MWNSLVHTSNVVSMNFIGNRPNRWDARPASLSPAIVITSSCPTSISTVRSTSGRLRIGGGIRVCIIPPVRPCRKCPRIDIGQCTVGRVVDDSSGRITSYEPDGSARKQCARTRRPGTGGARTAPANERKRLADSSETRARRAPDSGAHARCGSHGFQNHPSIRVDVDRRRIKGKAVDVETSKLLKRIAISPPPGAGIVQPERVVQPVSFSVLVLR